MLQKLKTQGVKCKTMVLLLYVLTFTLFASSASAQASASSSPTSNLQPQYPSSSLQLPTSISPTSPLYTDLLVNNLFHSFSCLAIGQSLIGQPCLTYQMTKNAQGMLQGVPVLSQTNLSGGALGATTSLIGMLYQNPPVRTADYLASVGQGLGIVKTANAQVVGSGAAVLNPILQLWQVSRNISYVIMIIIFLVIGLMVMFRNKLNPQTVITAQAALPGLVIGLIMITFSFFFAGLISDMAFIGTNVVGYYFSAVKPPTNPPTSPQNLVEDMKNQNVISVVSPLVEIVDRDSLTSALNSIWIYLGGWAQFVLTSLSVFVTAQTTTQGTEWLKAIPFAGAGIQAAVIGATAVWTSKNPQAMAGLALSFIASIILIYSMFKLLLRLINNYLTIIFLTITAPFQLLAAALPGRQSIATGWILNMLANVLAFPAVLVVLYFVAFLVKPEFLDQHCFKPCPFKVSQLNQTEYNAFVSVAQAEEPKSGLKITGNAAFPLFGGLDLSVLNLILAFGALIALPSIPDIIGRTIGRMSQVGQMLGQEIGGSVGAGRQYGGQFQQGIGTGSGQLAQGRGLFSTPVYEMDEKGKIKRSTWQSRPGAINTAGYRIGNWLGKTPAAPTSLKSPKNP